MPEMDEIVKGLAVGLKDPIARVQAKLAHIQRKDSKEYELERRQLNILCQMQEIVNAADQFTIGDQRALQSIESAISDHTLEVGARLTAVLLLCNIAPPGLEEILGARIGDRTEQDDMRFFCAHMLTANITPIGAAVTLRLINDRSTDTEYRQHNAVRQGLINAHSPINLKLSLVMGLLQNEAGRNAMEAQVNKPLTFQNGWTTCLLALWVGHEEEDEYMLLAASVLKGTSNPAQLRLNAAAILRFMRGRPEARFPNSVWDIIHKVWNNSAYGSLRHEIRELLRLQGTNVSAV